MSAASGTTTPTRKYAAPTQRSAFIGLPSCIWPRASIAPYTPHESTAPATNHAQVIPRLVVWPPAAALVWTAVAMIHSAGTSDRRVILLLISFRGDNLHSSDLVPLRAEQAPALQL